MPLKTVARGTGGGGGGSGTVTSVNVSGGTTGLTTTGGPITTAGEITIGGALNIANGGTGQTSKTAAFDALAPTTTKGDLVVYDGTDNIRLAVGTNGYYLKADSTTGSGLAWDSVAAGGVTSVTATAPLASSGGATPDISLTGIVPIANGGTGETTDVAAFDALAPTTTKGDIIVFDGSDNIRLGVGTNGYVLTADTASASGVSWASVGGGGSGTTTYAVTFNNGGTGDASGTTFDGSVARTISYNTFGAANSGANTNITSLDSITGGISSPDYVQFDTTATVTGAVGKLWYDSGDGTLVTQLKGGNVDLQIGQENVVLAYNNSGTTINKGQVVAVNGAQGQRPAVVLADADSEPLSAATLGVANESIGAGAEGFVATFGTIRGINTNGFTAGDPVYLSQTAGAFTSTRPSAPAHTVFLGWVVKVNSSSGELFLNINNGWELDELHNVLITSPTNGDLLQYDSTGPYWENVAASNVTVGSATSAADIVGGAANQLLYQDTIGSTSFATAPTVTNSFLKWNGSAFAWDTVTSGTVTSVDVLGGTTGLTTSGGPVTGSGTITLAGTLAVANGGTGQTSYTDGQLLIGNSSTTGLSKATLTAGSNVTITNGNGTITIASTASGTGDVVGPSSATSNAVPRYDGTTGKLIKNSSFTINDAGEVMAGTWTASTITALYGGTGQTSYSNGQLLIGNASGGLTKATLTAGSNVTITNGDGAITIASTGGGGGSSVILENQRTISSNYTVTDGYNGLSVGPVAISSNVSVTVGTDERWVVLNF